jgi:bifunctional N-acetylglucosamine-1-phosphate-uridyltransferase/glucosamine-1-phosphate-acetyltransferase GlmU-like protein
VLRIGEDYIVDAIGKTFRQAFGQRSSQIFLTIGWERELIRCCLGDRYRYLTLPSAPGRDGHAGLGPAVRLWAALDQLQAYDGPVIACYADMPFVSQTSLQRLSDALDPIGRNGLAMLTADEAPVAGRVVRESESGDGPVLRVVHDREVARRQEHILERDVGFYAFRNVHRIRDALGRIKNDNVKHEYGIHQLIEELVKADGRVDTVPIAKAECWTINEAADLGWLALGGHRAGQQLDLEQIYEQFTTHYGATFSYQKLKQIYPWMMRVLHPDAPARPQAPLHFLAELVEEGAGAG